jgi:hypothetical protein
MVKTISDEGKYVKVLVTRVMSGIYKNIRVSQTLVNYSKLISRAIEETFFFIIQIPFLASKDLFWPY